jgi:hypothetical protein
MTLPLENALIAPVVDSFRNLVNDHVATQLLTIQIEALFDADKECRRIIKSWEDEHRTKLYAELTKLIGSLYPPDLAATPIQVDDRSASNNHNVDDSNSRAHSTPMIFSSPSQVDLSSEESTSEPEESKSQHSNFVPTSVSPPPIPPPPAETFNTSNFNSSQFVLNGSLNLGANADDEDPLAVATPKRSSMEEKYLQQIEQLKKENEILQSRLDSAQSWVHSCPFLSTPSTAVASRHAVTPSPNANSSSPQVSSTATHQKQRTQRHSFNFPPRSPAANSQALYESSGQLIEDWNQQKNSDNAKRYYSKSVGGTPQSSFRLPPKMINRQVSEASRRNSTAKSKYEQHSGPATPHDRSSASSLTPTNSTNSTDIAIATHRQTEVMLFPTCSPNRPNNVSQLAASQFVVPFQGFILDELAIPNQVEEKQLQQQQQQQQPVKGFTVIRTRDRFPSSHDIISRTHNNNTTTASTATNSSNNDNNVFQRYNLGSAFNPAEIKNKHEDQNHVVVVTQNDDKKRNDDDLENDADVDEFLDVTQNARGAQCDTEDLTDSSKSVSDDDESAVTPLRRGGVTRPNSNRNSRLDGPEDN